MIISTNRIFKGFDGFVVWPFIFIRPELRHNKGILEHEMVHYREQRRMLVLPWLIAYGISKRFRLNAEVRAYKQQIKVGGISITEAAKALLQYRLNITFQRAYELLGAHDE